MKLLFIFSTTSICLALKGQTFAQTVHPTGANTITINWQPTSNTDSLRVDVDGDNLPDITFQENNYLPTGASQPTRYQFMATGAATELALDSIEFDSVHRFAAGDAIGPGLRWAATRGYLAYTLLGNGGVGGRGFFRNGASGYLVMRKRVAGNWQYWWFNLAGRSNSTNSQVSFYGQSSGVLATVLVTASTVQVFPNPSAEAWQLRGTGSYNLTNAQGHVVRSGTVRSATSIDNLRLPAGLYMLHFQDANGTNAHRKLVRL